MHEYAILSALLDRVQREVDAHPGAIVRALRVRIGDASGVEPDLLATAFATLRARSVCADAELAIERVAAAWRCVACDHPIAPGDILRCARCHRPARLTQGDDIVLDRIEMEVPDV